MRICLLFCILLAFMIPAHGEGLNLNVLLVPRKSSESLSYFDYKLNPGEQSSDGIRVTNKGKETVHLRIYSSDAYNGPDGGLAGPLYGEPVQQVGTGVKVSKEELVLKPDQSEEVSFTFSPPLGTTPGDHFGFVFIQAEAPDSGSDQGGAGSSFSLDMQTRIGVTLWQRTPGELESKVILDSPKRTIRNGRLFLVSEIRNLGNQFHKPKSEWQLLDSEGAVVLREDWKSLGYSLPQGTIYLECPVLTDRPLSQGQYTLKISVQLAEETLQEEFVLTLP